MSIPPNKAQLNQCNNLCNTVPINVVLFFYMVLKSNKTFVLVVGKKMFVKSSFMKEERHRIE